MSEDARKSMDLSQYDSKARSARVASSPLHGSQPPAEFEAMLSGALDQIGRLTRDLEHLTQLYRQHEVAISTLGPPADEEYRLPRLDPEEDPRELPLAFLVHMARTKTIDFTLLSSRCCPTLTAQGIGTLQSLLCRIPPKALDGSDTTEMLTSIVRKYYHLPTDRTLGYLTTAVETLSARSEPRRPRTQQLPVRPPTTKAPASGTATFRVKKEKTQGNE